MQVAEAEAEAQSINPINPQEELVVVEPVIQPILME
jgi:hypothetical protein